MATRSLSSLSVVASLFTFWACSSSDGGGTAPSADAGAGTADAAPSDDASTGADAAPASLSPLPSATDMRVEVGHDDASTFQNLYFYNVRASGTDRCATQAKGACFFRDCRGTGAPPGTLDAGKVTVSNPGGDVSWDLTTDADKNYNRANGAAKLLDGDAFEVVAAGGADLGAFQAQGTLPPKGPALKAPPSSATIDRSQDLVFEWTPGEGTIALGVFAGGPSAPYLDNVEIRCHVDASAGTFTLPADLLTTLEVQSRVATHTNIFFGYETVSDVTVGTDTVSVSAFSYIANLMPVK